MTLSDAYELQELLKQCGDAAQITADDIQKRRLTGTGWPEKYTELTFLHGEIHAAEDFLPAVALAETFTNIAYFKKFLFRHNYYLMLSFPEASNPKALLPNFRASPLHGFRLFQIGKRLTLFALRPSSYFLPYRPDLAINI